MKNYHHSDNSEIATTINSDLFHCGIDEIHFNDCETLLTFDLPYVQNHKLHFIVEPAANGFDHLSLTMSEHGFNECQHFLNQWEYSNDTLKLEFLNHQNKLTLNMCANSYNLEFNNGIEFFLACHHDGHKRFLKLHSMVTSGVPYIEIINELRYDRIRINFYDVKKYFRDNYGILDDSMARDVYDMIFEIKNPNDTMDKFRVCDYLNKYLSPFAITQNA